MGSELPGVQKVCVEIHPHLLTIAKIDAIHVRLESLGFRLVREMKSSQVLYLIRE